MNVEDVIRIKIEEAARKIEAARRQRETRQEARRRGLAQRHAQKLRNLAADRPPDNWANATRPNKSAPNQKGAA